MSFVIVRQGVIDKLGDYTKISLKKANSISPDPLKLLNEKPECPWAAGVYKLEDDWDTLSCVDANWDTSD